MDINLPESKVVGTFASGVRVSHSRHVFILDFIVHDDRHGPDTFLVAERVRLDPTAMQAVLGSLSQQLDAYERQFGDPRPPADPDA